MYPVLILTHVPDFLDTSGMGVTVSDVLGDDKDKTMKVVIGIY